MHNVWSIAKAGVRLIFRGGAGWGILAAVVAVVAMIFFSCNADGVLLNELRLRIRYSSYFFVGFLSFCVLFIACISMRGDIEGKQMHMLTSFPVKRWQIWLGKWLSIVIFAGLGLLSGTAAVAGSAAFFSRSWAASHPGERLPAAFWQFQRTTRPVTKPLARQVDELYQTRLVKGELPAGRSEWEIRAAMMREIRRSEQLLEPGQSRTWQFEVNKAEVKGDSILLSYRFYAQDDRKLVDGRWIADSAEGVERHEQAFSSQPYHTHQLSISVDVIPAAGRFRLTFEPAETTPSLIFPQDNGLQVLYHDSGLAVNLLRALLINLSYMGVVAAVGLSVSTAFTFAVSAFVSVVLLVVAVSSGFFQTVAREMLWEAPTISRMVSHFVIRVGIWLSRGMQPPPVLSRFSEGESVRIADIVMTWGASALSYAAIVAAVGMLLLTRKELDRVH